MENHKLTEEEFKSLFDENISVKKQKDLMAKVCNRFSYIMEQKCKILNKRLNWYDFDNEGGESSPGYFDPDIYKSEIGFVGHIQHIDKKNNFDKYDYAFPTVWLKEDFEKGLEQEFKEFLQEKDLKKKREKEENLEFIKTLEQKKQEILSLLTPEQACFINMANKAEINSRLKKLQAQKYKDEKAKKKIK